MVLSPAVVALLWAAAVFPGAGHLHLKYFQRGIALVIVTLISLSVLLIQFARIVVQLTANPQINASLLKVATLTLQACAADSLLMASLWMLVLTWLFGMADAYRLGKKAQRK